MERITACRMKNFMSTNRHGDTSLSPCFPSLVSSLGFIQRCLKILYALSLTGRVFPEKNGYIEPDGTIRLYFTLEELKRKLHRSRQVTTRAFQELSIMVGSCRRQDLGRPIFKVIATEYHSEGQRRAGGIEGKDLRHSIWSWKRWDDAAFQRWRSLWIWTWYRRTYCRRNGRPPCNYFAEEGSESIVNKAAPHYGKKSGENGMMGTAKNQEKHVIIKG